MKKSNSDFAFDERTLPADWAAIGSLQGIKRRCMEYLAENLPLSDIDSYPAELFMRFVKHSVMLRETMPWCTGLDEGLFLDYVLFPRANNEDLSWHRELFYQELLPRVTGLTSSQAVLEVNLWCAEHASYEAQDLRTASPLTVYRSGSGRCGEESAFAVAALRSIGIPARQVYVPRWAHCDDNHAWCEAYCNGEWRFFGACEPEPVLDRGWFNAAASRAMLAQSSRFSGKQTNVSPELHGRYVRKAGAIAVYNQTARYAETITYTIRITIGGKPVSGALVRIEIPNFGELHPIAEMHCGEDGTVSIEMGKGDFYVTAFFGNYHAEGLCDISTGSEFEFELDDAPLNEDYQAVDINAPEGGSRASALSAELQRQRSAEQQRTAATRKQYMESFAETIPSGYDDLGNYFAKCRGNAAALAQYLAKDSSETRVRFLRTLSDKDFRDVTAEILESHYTGAMPFYGCYDEDTFWNYIAVPRIADEMLTSWREQCANVFSTEQREVYKQEPAALWEYLCANIQPADPERVSATLYWPPLAALSAGRCDAKSRDVLFVALLRSWGLPARLSPLNRAPEYWQDGEFIPVKIESAPKGKVCFIKQDGEDYSMQNWSVSLRSSEGLVRMQIKDGWSGNRLCVELPLGNYRMVTSVRLPSGSQRLYIKNFRVGEDNEDIELQLWGYSVKDSLVSRDMPEFYVIDKMGMKISWGGISDNRATLLFWLEIGAEPTEHILNELIESKEKYSRLAPRIVFLKSEEAENNATLYKLLSEWKGIEVFNVDWEESMEAVCRPLFCDPGNPPLAVACNGEGKAVFAHSGYSVGLIELLAEVVGCL